MIIRLSKITLLAVALLIIAFTYPENSDGAIADAGQSMLRRTIEHDGIEREYFVHIPPGFGDGPLPLVVAIHGYTSTATGFQASRRLNPHADENDYVVVYPQGSHFRVEEPGGNTNLVTSWNDLAANLPPRPEGPHCVEDAFHYPCPEECGACNRCAWTSCYDDVGFIEKMLDEVQSEFTTDVQRTYLLGVSNGGMMVLRLGCNLSSRFAAATPIIAQLAPGYACGPDPDLPMLHLYGGKDNTVRHDGKPAGDGFIYTTAEKSTAVWANAMGCKAGPTHWENEYSRAAGLTCSGYSDCETPDHEVVSCMDPDESHNWPAQGVKSMPATCVTAEQYDSLPGQDHCPSSADEAAHAGMDLVWNFMQRYRSTASE